MTSANTKTYKMTDFAQALIYVHAGFGGLALFTGAVSLIAVKGSKAHRKFGLVFYYSMLTSACLALLISVLPNHESAFLFAIGLFSTYFILMGYRARHFKRQSYDTKTERLMAITMMALCVGMMGYPIIFLSKVNVILFVFGLLGLSIGLRDYNLLKQRESLRKGWLKIHLSNMIGGYVAATTAFVVVNKVFPGISGWFIPSVLGGIYTVFWMIKRNRVQS